MTYASKSVILEFISEPAIGIAQKPSAFLSVQLGFAGNQMRTNLDRRVTLLW
jgi:hypothetical protein